MSILKFAIAAALVAMLPCAVSAQVAPPAGVKLSAKTATQGYYAARPEARIWQDKIDAALATKKETRVNLASRVPVHILYPTVVSEEGGGIRYLDDIYQRDAAVLAGLRAPLR